MLFSTLAPCISAVALTDGFASLQASLNSDSGTEYTREYSFNTPEKAENNTYILETDMGTGVSLLSIYTSLRNEIKTATSGSYYFGTEDTPMGTPDSSWTTSAPTITESHPRLLVTRDNIPNIRAALEDNNPTNERFFDLLDKPTSYINNGKLAAAEKDYGGRPGLHNYRGDYLEFIQVKALGYLVDGHELYGYQAIHCMKQYLRTLDIQYISSNMEREYGNTMFTTALVYDWCYDLLTAEDARQLRVGLQNRTAKGTCGDPSYTSTTHYKWKMSVGYPPTNIGAVSGHASERQLLRDYLSAAIAFYGDNNSWYDYIGKVIYSEYVPVRNYYFRSGISQQGVGTYVSGRHIADMFSAWMLMTATGTQPYENIDKTVRNFLGYETAPGKIFSDGDGSGSQQNNHEFRALSYMTAYLFEDEAMLAQARDMLPNQAFGEDARIDLTIELHSALYVALTGMSNIEPAEDKYEGMPLIQYNGSPVGQYVTHEAFGVNDSASVFMKIKERTTANHEHADAGNFMIYYKGMLTADGGVYNGYGGAHTRYYHQATVSHNSILVYDSSKADTSSSDPATKWYSGGQIWPNEAKTLSQLKTETYHTGNVIGNRHGYYDDAKTQPKFAYLNGNLVYAYPEETVSSLGRRMLTVYTGDEDVPMLFFVYDTIGAVSASYEKKFLLHISSSEAPTVNTTNKTVTTTNGDGKLVLTVMSEDTKITKVGGRTYGTDGKYDASESKNYLINGLQNSTTNDYDVGSWGRVEVSATNNSKSSKILNAMYVTDATNSKTYSMKPITNVSSLQSSLGDFEGAVFEGKIAAVFAKKDVTGARTGTVSYMNKGAHSFTTEGDGTISYYVDGLEAGNWNVTVNGKSAGTVKVSYGLATFDAPAGEVVLTKESSELTTLKADLLNALGAKITNTNGTYTTDSYTAYSNAYDALVAKINNAASITEANAINVASEKANAEAKLVSGVAEKKEELLAQLGSKLSNSSNQYSSTSYSAYSSAYDAIVTNINNATTIDALNKIDVATLKAAAEANLVSTVDEMKAALKAALGTKITNNNVYTSASYSAYSSAYDDILASIDDATTLTELNRIDVATEKANAESKLVTLVSEKKDALIAELGAKKANTGYTSDSYSAYSAEYTSILNSINNATTLAQLNAINVSTLKAAAEALLQTDTADSDTITSNGGSASKDVILNYEDSVSADEVYSVDVTWTDLTFEYNAGKAQWDPQDHDYTSDVITGAGWVDSSGSITVTNHSNAKVGVTITFEKASAANGNATLSISNSSYTLESAENTTVANAPYKKSTITASGTPTHNGSLGSLIVTIKKGS